MTKETKDKYQKEELRQYKLFVNEIKNESDRAAVILGTSQLDVLLYQLIEGFLLPSTSSRDDLLDGDKPLASFSARINFAYRVGLIDAEFVRALHIVRKIRNSYAHEVSGVSLTTGPHRDRIRELFLPFSNNTVFTNLLPHLFGPDLDTASQFRSSIAFMAIRLQGAVSRVKRVICSKPCSLLPSPRSMNKEQNVEVRPVEDD